MDATTLATWIGHDADQYDLDAAAEALAGIDLDTEPARALEILARHELPADELTAWVAEVWRLATTGGGTIKAAVPLTVEAADERDDAQRNVAISWADARERIWIDQAKTTADARDLHARWEQACAEVEQDQKAAAQATSRAMAAAREAERAWREAVRLRDEAVRAERATGTSGYKIAKREGVSTTLMSKIR